MPMTHSPLDMRIRSARGIRHGLIAELDALAKAQHNFRLSGIWSRDAFKAYRNERRRIVIEINYYSESIMRWQWERNYIARLTRKVK